MATAAEATKEVREEQHVGRELEKATRAKAKRDKSVAQEPMAAYETRLARLELTVAEHHDRWDEADQRMEQLEADELRGAMQESLNDVVEQFLKGDDAVRLTVESLRAEVGMLKGELEACRSELARCARLSVEEPSFVREELARLKADVDAMRAQGTGGTLLGAGFAPRVEVPKPAAYGGERKARDIENFLFGLQRYFEALGVMADEVRLRTAPLYLKDSALIWWRRKVEGGRMGERAITTWETFKTELKAEFEPANAEHEARTKLRRLQHKDGQLRDYIDEFSNLLLEIPTMTQEDALFTFLDGLRPWARQRIEDKDPEGLSQAIKAAQRLMEFPHRDQRDSTSRGSWPKDQRDGANKGGGANQGSSGGDRAKSPTPTNGGKPREKPEGKWRSDKPRAEFKCYICQEPSHYARDCPHKTKLSAIIQEECSVDKPRRIACMRLNAVHAKVEDRQKGRLYVDATIAGYKAKALVDTGADVCYMSKDVARELGIDWSPSLGGFKGVNGRATKLDGIARDVPVELGEWKGTSIFFIAPLDDYKVVLGMDLLYHLDPIMEPKRGTMVVRQGDWPCIVNMCREPELGSQRLQGEVRVHEATSEKGMRQGTGSANGQGTGASLGTKMHEETTCKTSSSSVHLRTARHGAEPTKQLAGHRGMEDPKVCLTDQWLIERIRVGLMEDPQANVFKEKVAWGKMAKYWLEDGLVYTTGPAGACLYVPDCGDLRDEVIKSCHTEQRGKHLDCHGTFARVQRCYHWPKLRSNVDKFARRCHGCKAAKWPSEEHQGIRDDA